PDLRVGFTAISSFMILGLAQTIVSYRGDSLIPGFGGNRPVVSEPEGRGPNGAMLNCPASAPHWRRSLSCSVVLSPLAFGSWCATNRRGDPRSACIRMG